MLDIIKMEISFEQIKEMETVGDVQELTKQQEDFILLRENE